MYRFLLLACFMVVVSIQLNWIPGAEAGCYCKAVGESTQISCARSTSNCNMKKGYFECRKCCNPACSPIFTIDTVRDGKK
ncbi:hypothetical protein DdX_04219 [Ditylenchus destructor]|uniref:Uncharacterized protein n=1 Tax=Ditylenchus destructor TaxID=166010 RepID=A0AAD4NE31_9BILA|nr:hypothetical protein DdX_04219 [Ditylenchus destructor]